MKYCLNYAKSSKVLIKEAAEINIIYDKNDAELPAFIEAHPEQRINLILTHPENAFDAIEIKKFQAIAEKYPNAQLHLCIYSSKRMSELDEDLIAKVKETNLPWFTGQIVTTWDALMYLICLGVSDVYIGEDLGFEIPAVSKVCKEHMVAVRVFPNVAQSSINATPALMKFFIRPEDLKVYEPYIDTIEFWGELTQQDTFYKIYQKGEWLGPLNQIIFSFNSDMESHRVMPIFGNLRVDCGKACLRGKRCSICHSLYSISNHMKKHSLMIKNRD